MDAYTKQIKEIISEQAGMDIEDILEESFLEDDLNLGEMEIHTITEELEEKYEIDLSEEFKTFETVEDIINAVLEKVE